ncbi:hypothetical protein BG910_09710 [Neisseria chenwenguii]|uniref:DNA2/NAM7 helicase-like C-terminal domain-containing protein n=1 Tax=Neisseria chenwenguii TaxID=1853278 RepID=A0A220S3R1_9NEIS|nr:AAA domain-containing protein [Neisseria chenwenguii]ASK27963.1 hypothetical protein BG910_09710 [Neisseria chenwenguii]
MLQGSVETWIGSPLRVHRRCVEPMFGIANAIAYENKMIFFNPSPELPKRQPETAAFHLGPSSWVQVAGEAKPRQFVQEQADLVIEMLDLMVKRENSLPDLYIITPFKQIKNKVIEQIVGRVGFSRKGELKKWCNANIGTVHTFQGKEEKAVWLVLGCDRKTGGAADWAAGKPNLLNVALTRAKQWVFVIGDRELWGRKLFFKVAAQRLGMISGEEFKERVLGKERLSEQSV